MPRGWAGLRRLRSSGVGCALRVAGSSARFELGDEVFEVVGLARQIGGSRPLGFERFFGRRLLFLPFVDQQIQCAAACGRARRDRGPGARVSLTIPLRTLSEIGEVAGNRIGLARMSGNHAAERDRGSHRLQRVLRLTNSAGGGWWPTRCKHGREFPRWPPGARRAICADGFLLIERFEPRCVSPRCSPRRRARASAVSISCWLSARRSSPIVSISRRSLAWLSADSRSFCADRIELLIALLERVGIRLRGAGACRGRAVSRRLRDARRAAWRHSGRPGGRSPRRARRQRRSAPAANAAPSTRRGSEGRAAERNHAAKGRRQVRERKMVRIGQHPRPYVQN